MRPSAKFTPNSVLVLPTYNVLEAYWASMMRSPALVSP